MSCLFNRILRQDFGPENNRIRLRRRQWQMKLARLTAIAVAAFMLSWSPYCFVSLVSIFKGNYLLSPGEAEVPELMAKASVIYNPFVYTFMNRRFRMTLWAIVSCRHCKWRLFSKSKESSSDAQECVTEKRNSIRPSWNVSNACPMADHFWRRGRVAVSLTKRGMACPSRSERWVWNLKVPGLNPSTLPLALCSS